MLDNAAGMPTRYGALPGTPGTYTDSPASSVLGESPRNTWASAAQFISPAASVLAFVDWPERIGIDNLALDTQCSGRCLRDEVPRAFHAARARSWAGAARAQARVAAKKPARGWL
jgi:hypothetical protein